MMPMNRIESENFIDLNLPRLKKYANEWLKRYSCIQRIELFGSNYDCRYEFEFVVVCTVPQNPFLSEKRIEIMPKEDAFGHQHILYEYYGWVGDNSSWKHIEWDIPRFYKKGVDLSKRNISMEWRWITISPDGGDSDDLVGAWADVEGTSIVLYGNSFEPENEKVLTLDDVLIKIMPDVELFYLFVKKVMKNEEMRTGVLSACKEHLVKALNKKKQFFRFLEEEHLNNFSEVNKIPRDIKAPVIQKMVELLFPHIYVDSIASNQQKLFQEYTRIKKRTK